MCIEFLGGRLSHCSSIEAITSNGLLYYASRSGDSYIVQVTSQKQSDTPPSSKSDVNPCLNPDLVLNDRPYLQIIEEHQSLAPVIDI